MTGMPGLLFALNLKKHHSTRQALMPTVVLIAAFLPNEPIDTQL